MSRWKSRLRRSALGCGVLLPILGIATLVWYRSAYNLPPEDRRDVPLPIPNGYDTLVAATQRRVPELEGIHSSSLPGDPPQPLAGRQKLVKANLPAIAQLRQGLTQPYLIPPTGAKAYTPFAQFRDMARLLAFCSDTYADAGDLPQATRCALDAIELGITVPRGGPLIPGLVGIATEAIGQRSLWKLADRLDARTARAAAQRLATLEPRRWSFAQTLPLERAYFADITRMTYKAGPLKGTWENLGVLLEPGELEPGEAPANQPPPGLRGRAGALWDRTKAFYYGPRMTLANADRWLAAVAQHSREPWGARPTLPETPDDPLSQAMLPQFTQAEFKWVHVQAFASLLQTYLAVRAYRLEQGAYPPHLAALVTKGYLKSLPADAFSPTRAPLRYRTEPGDRMVLWSVGPDARDDGGRAAVVLNEKGQQRRGYVNRDSRGDIVARVNTW